MSTRTGPTRIPIFGSRIPVPGQQPKEPPRAPVAKTSQPVREVAACDVGKRVRVLDLIGTLRYFGGVHFAKGSWCGVELSNAEGKNDGTVQGVRYFQCPPLCGLMLPVSNVTLIDNQETAEDCASGPYSILFGLDKEPISNATFVRDEGRDGDNAKVDDSNANHSNEVAKDDTIVKEQNQGLLKTDVLNESLPQKRRNTFTIEGESDSKSETYNKEEYFQNSYSTTVIENLERTFASENPKIIDGRRSTLLHNTFNVNRTYNTGEIDNKNSCTHKALEDKPLPKSANDTFSLKHSFMNVCDTPDLMFNKYHSTPRFESEGSPSRKIPSACPGLEDEGNKRDSLELEESLGILTPNQMVDTNCFPSVLFSRTPSSENINSLPLDSTARHPEKQQPELASPNHLDTSFSLGIIDENVISNLKTDTTTNMELPLDSIGRSNKEFALNRLDQTPSPEELPLDPTPVAETEPKTDNTKSKTSTNSYIASIASITSLDTGYQGDGEMSRPASRGADNSPMTRRPLPRPQPRRPDPMTDSDFYTESDADNHEEHPLRGDRRAQVIDGTLYGVDPQAAADIYVNNRENMDSSGVFTDIESSTRADELQVTGSDLQNDTLVAASPSDSSTKSISDNSQKNVLTHPTKNSQKFDSVEQHNLTITKNTADIGSKAMSPTPSSVSSPASVRSPRHTVVEEKKHKMPKRNVTSKVKAMMESGTQQRNEKIVAKTKTVGRWDAVMNKISKNPIEESKNKLKEVKSKVFSGVQTAGQKVCEVRKTGISPKNTNIKPRRIRSRMPTATASKSATTIGKTGSAHSSLSDVSGGSPAKKNSGSAKKKDVVRVTQVLTTAKLSPRNPQLSTTPEVKKSATLPTDAKPPKKSLFISPREKKQTINKECNRGTIKGGRTSPNVRPQTQTRAQIKQIPTPTQIPRTTEALAVLVQHLVFNLEAFRVPSLRREVERARLQAEEDRLAYRHLEETLHEERLKQAAAIEEERKRFRAEITDLIEQHRAQITQLNHEHSQTQHLLSEAEKCKRQLQKDYEDQLRSLKVEFNKLQRTHEESLDILREENDSIREQIDENKMVIEGLMHYKHESHKLKSEYEAKEKKYKEQLQCANEEIERLKAEKQEFLCAGQDGQNTSVQEVQSLRAVLELKQVEVSELRKNLAEALQRADLLPTVEEKVSTLTARCEDLQLQLERKNVYEQQILQDKKKLEESFKEENNQKKRLLQYNEELQWRLKQNKEVVSHVLEQAEEGTFNRSLLTFSFNERHNSTAKSNLERALSFRERALSNKSNCSTDSFNESKSKATFDFLCDKVSPPSSPKVKGVVEKSDSVSYVLDLDESPEVVASRIVRRSFRNSTPPKNTPTKSPANKRPRMKNPLSLSASASAIVPSRIDRVRSRSANVRNPDYDQAENVFVWPSAATSTPREPKFSEVDIANFDLNNGKAKLDENLDLEDEDDDIDIPGLPSEIGRKNSAEELPAPHQLAGESMIFESNSEDESTSSSSVQL